MHPRHLKVAIVLAAIAVLGTTTVATAASGPDVSRTTMSGYEEVPGPGDPNGFGRSVVQTNPQRSQVCVSIRYFGIDPPTMAHIHAAPMGVSGDVVVDFTPLLATSAPSYIQGCVPVETTLARDIQRNPSDYYTNVHNAAYPAGAIRGQLG